MTNQELLQKMKEDMEMRGFSHWTKESYELKAKDTMRYFKKPMEEVTTEELRNFLLKYLKEERKLSERSVNYYNSVIRFMYEVTMDKLINKKQLPMYRKRRKMKDVLTKEELSTFFNVCDNYMYKTIFMLIYGSGLRVSEAVSIKVHDIDSRKMRIFVSEGKGKKEVTSATDYDGIYKVLNKYAYTYRDEKTGRGWYWQDEWYDFAGNVWEWTLEHATSDSHYPCSERGGAKDYIEIMY